jgi:hypothetical protein
MVDRWAAAVADRKSIMVGFGKKVGSKTDSSLDIDSDESLFVPSQSRLSGDLYAVLERESQRY